ncbi:MAG: UDP-N-acetylglucosamine 2-epimerase (non-hydrolyzing) [Actinobacteria bacterium]|nr:UDP-N-acetylglucosamine 2-epimerase (non-hydrolyzing) [Actinomycetota bacterium]
MKIATVVGSRPQFIKMAPVSKVIRKNFKELIIHTGQHYDYEMDRIFFEELDIPLSDYYLGVGSGTHGYQTGEMLKRIEEILINEKPDFVLVYGDTNSTLAGALAGAKLGIKVAHVEAGLRSFDKSMPEEINRVITDHCSNILFCPTKTAVKNLNREGINDGAYLTGDVMVDSLLHNKEIAESKSGILEKLELKSNEYIVATIHRASNTDRKEKLDKIVNSFCELGETIIFPIHPRTEKYLKEYGLFDKLRASVRLTKPLGYLDFLKLMIHAKKIVTDSGGIQKEAYILKVPCITLRENTEWVETVEDGWNVLVSVDKENIRRAIHQFQPSLSNHKEIFGNGSAAKEIFDYLEISK